MMTHYRKSLVLEAHPAAVYAALTTPQGLRGWWTEDCVVFRLAPEDEARTHLDFEHVGLVPALQCYGLCSDGWNHFLGSLQRFVETGHGTPQ
jgi:uncharacterized protein YndB with AHSA1/START domain